MRAAPAAIRSSAASAGIDLVEVEPTGDDGAQPDPGLEIGVGDQDRRCSEHDPGASLCDALLLR